LISIANPGTIVCDSSLAARIRSGILTVCRGQRRVVANSAGFVTAVVIRRRTITYAKLEYVPRFIKTGDYGRAVQRRLRSCFYYLSFKAWIPEAAFIDNSCSFLRVEP